MQDVNAIDFKIEVEKLRKQLDQFDFYAPDERRPIRDMFTVNVKLHHLNSDLDDAIKNAIEHESTKAKPYLNTSKRAQIEQAIRKEYTDALIGELYDEFLQTEREHIIDVISGREEWFGNDEREKYLPVIADYLETAGFYGRNAGHFCLVEKCAVDEMLDVVADDELSDDERLAELKKASDLLDAITWFLEDVKATVNSIEMYGWQNYLTTNIGNFIDDYVKSMETKQKQAQNITSQTLAELLSHEDETIRRNAMSILKQSQKLNVKKEFDGYYEIDGKKVAIPL